MFCFLDEGRLAVGWVRLDGMGWDGIVWSSEGLVGRSVQSSSVVVVVGRVL